MNQAATPQPAPQPGQRVVLDQVVQDLRDRPGDLSEVEPIIADLAARAEMGFKKYGCYLQTHNGRDALMDAYQENLDLVMYLGQALQECGSDPVCWLEVWGLYQRSMELAVMIKHELTKREEPSEQR
jgi:hypothetical protein